LKNYIEILLTLNSGAISGALVLGIAGRAAIAIVTLAQDNSLYLSSRGVVEVMLLGTLIGAVGGCLLFMLGNMFRGYGIVTGIVTGLILFSGAMLFAIARRRIDFDKSFIQLPTTIVVFIIFAIYGVVVIVLLNRFTGNRK
jgi:hypothetical protein